MKKIITLLLATFSLSALGQSNSVYNASTYAYTTQVTGGNASTGSSSILANPTAFAQGIPFLPYNINASITINRNASNAETDTPGPIANCFPNSLTCTLSSTFTFKHVAGESIQSGTFGLQEALNIAVTAGSGTVLIDASWQGPSGTSLILAAKGASTVMIQDNRNPSGATFYQWNGSAYVSSGGGGGGSGTVTSVFGRTPVVVAQTGDYTCSQVTGCPATAVTSINGDTTAAQHIAGTGGITCTTSGGITTCNYSGSAGSGAVATAALQQMGCYLAVGTTISGCPNVFVINTGSSASQITSLLGGLSGTNTYIIPAGTPQALYNSNGQIPWDMRLGASWFQMPGIACDGTQSAINIPLTSGSNQTTGIGLFTAADQGKTFFFFNRSGYGFGSTQSVWTATLTNVTGTTLTWSANAPFSFNTQVYYGTDNLATVQAAMTKASSTFPLTIPTGCSILVNGTIQWNNNQVIVGRHQGSGGFIGAPGKDVISTVDSTGNGVSTVGTGLKGFTVIPSTEVDATLGYNLYAANGTLTVVPPIYRPAYDHSTLANNPCGPGWIVGCGNGVASTTQNSAVVCTPNAYTPPAVGANIVFPYGPKVFTTTVSSTAGSCSGGFTARTLTTALPNVTGYTVTQNEWFTGSSIQATTTTIPGSPTYPFTIQLVNAVKPVPGAYSNFAQDGHGKIQDYEFDYAGVNYLTNQVIIRKGPATVNGGAGYSGTNTIVPLNKCAAKNIFGSSSDQPYPVVPTINSGDSTPSGANWFPGECIGNAGVAFPTANGNVYVGGGLVGGFLEDLNFIGSAAPGSNSGNANNTADIYVAGNNSPFASRVQNITSSNVQYGYINGPASSGQHGVAAVGPTGIGNVFRNLWLFAGFPLSFVDFQGSDITELNMNSAAISPFDGTPIGSANCLHVGFTLDEQTGGVVTSSQYDTFHGPYACEPENGSHITNLFAADIQGSHISFDTANFEGIPNVFGGDHLKLTNTLLSLPAIDYGTANDFGTLDGSNAAYPTMIWDGSPQFLSWGHNAKCSIWAGGSGPAQACSASAVQGYEGRGIDASIYGTKAHFILGGMINPWMWNNGSFDTNPFTLNGAADPSAPYWGASSQCALGGTNQCHVAHFNGLTGFMYIGPFGTLVDGPYTLDAQFKMKTAAATFFIIIRANDSGSGQCASGGSTTLYNNTISVGTSWTPFTATFDFTGHAGCILDISYTTGSTTDTIYTDRFNLIPTPGFVRGPATAPTYPGSCPAGTPASAWLGSFSGFTYFCDGTAVHRVAIS